MLLLEISTFPRSTTIPSKLSLIVVCLRTSDPPGAHIALSDSVIVKSFSSANPPIRAMTPNSFFEIEPPAIRQTPPFWTSIPTPMLSEMPRFVIIHVLLRPTKRPIFGVPVIFKFLPTKLLLSATETPLSEASSIVESKTVASAFLVTTSPLLAMFLIVQFRINAVPPLSTLMPFRPTPVTVKPSMRIPLPLTNTLGRFERVPLIVAVP